jgi:uncharacterized protein
MRSETLTKRLAVLLLFIMVGANSSCGSRALSDSNQQLASGTDIARQNLDVQTANKNAAQTTHKSPLPPPTGFVNDYANVFDAASKARLESVLVELKEKSNIEFAVVVVETTGGEPIFDYSLAVARGWGIGSKDTSKGGGLLLLLAIKEREWRLQVGGSLEKDLPDKLCKELGDKSADLYKHGQYSEGIINYVHAIIVRLEAKRGFTLEREL